MTNERSLTYLRYFGVGLFTLVMLFIFIMSSKTGDISSSISGKVMLAIVRFVKAVLGIAPSTKPINWAFIHFLVRKTAHVTEYTFLSFSVAMFMRSFMKVDWIFFVATILFCVFIAGTDEIHQYFIPGREGTPRDVLIDSIGIVFGVLIFQLVRWINHKATRRKARVAQTC